MTKQTKALYNALLVYSYVLLNLVHVKAKCVYIPYAGYSYFLVIDLSYTGPYDGHNWYTYFGPLCT